jgi:hypothetical protein
MVLISYWWMLTQWIHGPKLAGCWKLSTPCLPGKLSQDFGDHLAVYVGQAEVAALEFEGQPLVINAHQM